VGARARPGTWSAVRRAGALARRTTRVRSFGPRRRGNRHSRARAAELGDRARGSARDRGRGRRRQPAREHRQPGPGRSRLRRASGTDGLRASDAAPARARDARAGLATRRSSCARTQSARTRSTRATGRLLARGRRRLDRRPGLPARPSLPDPGPATRHPGGDRTRARRGRLADARGASTCATG
jgi:hypothetical protein